MKILHSLLLLGIFLGPPPANGIDEIIPGDNLFQTNIVDEYDHLRTNLRMSDEDVVKIARTGFEVAFLDDTERTRLLSAFDDAIASLQK